MCGNDRRPHARERLGVSPAAISSALRYLQQLDLVVREPVAGSRRDRYRLPDNAWYEASVAKDGVYRAFADLSETGVAALGGSGTPSGARIADMRDFFLFICSRIDGLMAEWQQLRGTRAQGSDPA